MGISTLLPGCEAPIDTSKDQLPDWAIGGTLHDTLLPQWAYGSDEDKLATAGEILYEALWQGHLQSEEELAAFRTQSEKLVQMMNDFSRLYPRMVQVNPAVARWTARSFVRDGVLEEREEMDKALGPASMAVERENPAP